MIPEKAFAGLLQLDERWSVAASDQETEPVERFLIVVRETETLWPGLRCPEVTCGQERIVCHDPAESRTWRHLDAFGKRTEILCALPRARCNACRKVWTVPAPWEGQGKHFTREFEAFTLTLTLMRETPVKKAGQILGENDTRLWRMLIAHGRAAYPGLDFSEVTQVGVDEMSLRKGHHSLTVFADLVERRVLSATEGTDSATFQVFADELLRHNGHPHGIRKVAMDLSAAYGKGMRQTLRNAEAVYDPFHVTALVSHAVDEVRRREAREGEDAAKAALKGSMHLFPKNPENLPEAQAEAMDQLDLKNLATGQAYQVRLERSDIYRQARTPQKARYRLEVWMSRAEAKYERWDGLLAPLGRAVKSIAKNLEGILAHWGAALSTVFMQGLNSVFSLVKRKARGYRRTASMVTMLNFVAGKLQRASYPGHGK